MTDEMKARAKMLLEITANTINTAAHENELWLKFMGLAEMAVALGAVSAEEVTEIGNIAKRHN